MLSPDYAAIRCRPRFPDRRSIMHLPGMIGGIGPESTIAYYRAILSGYRDRTHDGTYPSLLINSIDLTTMLSFIEAGQFDDLASHIIGHIRTLADAGATFAFLAANTPHVVFERLRAQSPLPLISIVEATCDEARHRGLRRVGILGTRFTMDGTFYRDVFSPHGIELFAPGSDDAAYMHQRYFGELVNGVFTNETHDAMVRIINRLHDQHAIEGIILGGTELPLLLTDSAYGSVQVLDTTAIHVQRILDEMLS
jgi:aspartate racemase